jgi:nucleoside-triphosphatase THEP1
VLPFLQRPLCSTVEKKNLLFTGEPGCGKSTLIEKIVKGLSVPARGFFTREMREGGRRTGFSITTLDGKHGILARKGLVSKKRVGGYGVCIEDIERILIPSMVPVEDELIVIDEIGRMECCSPLFRETLLTVLESENRVVGSIALHGGSFIEEIRRRNDVEIVRVTEQNRDALCEPYSRKLEG